MCGEAVCGVLANTYGGVSAIVTQLLDRALLIREDLLSWNLPDAAPVTIAVPFSRDAILSVTKYGTKSFSLRKTEIYNKVTCIEKGSLFLIPSCTSALDSLGLIG